MNPGSRAPILVSMRRWIPVTVLALGAALLVAPGASAQPDAVAIAPAALKKQVFAVNGSFRNFVVAPSGQPRGFGDIGVARGPVVDPLSGANAGSFTAVSRVISRKKDAELRDTQIQLDLKGGTVVAQAVNEEPAGKPPVGFHIMPVVGGTGAYLGARGVLFLAPVGSGGTFRFGIDIFTDARVTATNVSLGEWQTVTAPPVEAAPQGIGSITVRQASGADGIVTAVTTQVGRSGRTITTTTDLLLERAGGTIVARSVASAKNSLPARQTFTVLGGTGEFAGVHGEATLTSTGLALRLNARVGKRVVLSWFEQTTSLQELPVGGTTVQGGTGPMTAKAGGQGAKRGTWFSSVVTYPQVGDFLPVITTLEQSFTEGTMMVFSITNGLVEQASYERPVIGGTADFGSYGGSALSTPQGEGAWQRRATIWG